MRPLSQDSEDGEDEKEALLLGTTSSPLNLEPAATARQPRQRRRPRLFLLGRLHRPQHFSARLFRQEEGLKPRSFFSTKGILPIDVPLVGAKSNWIRNALPLWQLPQAQGGSCEGEAWHRGVACGLSSGGPFGSELRGSVTRPKNLSEDGGLVVLCFVVAFFFVLFFFLGGGVVPRCACTGQWAMGSAPLRNNDI